MAKSHRGNNGDGHKLYETSLIKLKKVLSGETVEIGALGDLAPVIKTNYDKGVLNGWPRATVETMATATNFLKLL